MKVLKILSALTILAMAVGLFGFTPSNVPVALAAKAVTYNIYATDGFISLADGTQLYMYGFVGGRSDQPVTYQNSVVAPPTAPKTYVPGALVTTANNTVAGLCGGNQAWPTPVGGPSPLNSCESQLAGNTQFPAPLIYAAVGDAVTINFKNLGTTNKTSPNDPHSIHLHGLDVDAANDGVPETSVGAVPANLAVPGAGNVIVYMFAPQNPGSYMYHCHQEADIHVQMGMYGALVVYDPQDPAVNPAPTAGCPVKLDANGTPIPCGKGPGTGQGGTLWGWKYDKDVVMLLSEIDVNQHVSEQQGLGGGAAFNPINYHPQYWFINGLSFPNTIHASAVVGPGAFNFVNWNKAYPNYDPLITGSVNKGEKVLIRVINMGFETQPMHMHGFHGKILGSDQRAWPWANKAGDPAFVTGLGLEKNTLTIGSGETYEWLVDFSQQKTTSTYAPGTQSRYYNGSAACQAAFTAANPGVPLPVLNTPVANTLTACPEIPMPGVPLVNYIGGPTVGGLAGNPTGPQIFPFHNHDDYKATNNGVYPGGMFTALIPLP